MSDEDLQNPYLLYPERETDKRVRYYDGQFLSSADFILAQSHPLDRHRRNLQATVSPGVVEGFAVHGETDAIVVAPGVAVDRHGRQMVLARNARRQIQQADRGKNLTLWICYCETATDDSNEEQGARGLTRFDETPTIDYTPDGGALPDGAMLIARLQVDGAGAVTPDTSGRPRAGLRIPGATPITLTTRDTDPGRGTLSGALRVTVPQGTAHSTVAPALDVRGHARVRNGMTIGQDAAIGYKGVVNDGNDLVVNGQFAAGGSGGAAMYKLGIGYGPPAEAEGTLTARRIAVGTETVGDSALNVVGNANFSSDVGVAGNIYSRNDVRVGGALDTGIDGERGDANNGKIAYQQWTDGLDIVGAGDQLAHRKITFHAQGGSRHIGDFRIEDDLVVTRDIIANRHIRANQHLYADQNANISGKTTTGTLQVNGATDLRGNTTATHITAGDRVTSANLTISDHAQLNNTAASGTTTLNGRANLNGDQLNLSGSTIANFGARVNANGDLLSVKNRLMPSVGSGNTKGIVWPGNPGGGSGDVAAIRYYAASGENTRLVLENGADAEDWIVLKQQGGNRVVVRGGKVGINRDDPGQSLDVGGHARTSGHMLVGDQLQVTRRIRPSTGTGNNYGICWDDNAFGGGGDFARIQYFRQGNSGENTKLQIANGNDADDWIVLHQRGDERLVVRNGRVGINRNDPTYSLDVSGTARTTGNVVVDGFVDLGVRDNGTRTGNSGQIKYKVHTGDSLEILGAGNSGGTRKIRMWAEGGLQLTGWMQASGGIKLHSDEYAVSARDAHTRVVWGAVKSNGSRWVGQGFTCERYGNHTGVFKIDFTPDFSSRPCVVATRHHPNDVDNSTSWGNTKDNAVVARVDKAWAIIVTGDSSGDRKYRSFEFIAIGRR